VKEIKRERGKGRGWVIDLCFVVCNQ
jgi:hypothetical protein